MTRPPGDRTPLQRRLLALGAWLDDAGATVAHLIRGIAVGVCTAIAGGVVRNMALTALAVAAVVSAQALLRIADGLEDLRADGKRVGRSAQIVGYSYMQMLQRSGLAPSAATDAPIEPPAAIAPEHLTAPEAEDTAPPPATGGDSDDGRAD